MVVRRTTTSHVTALTVFAIEMSLLVFVARFTRAATSCVRDVRGGVISGHVFSIIRVGFRV
jgi:hypothetical protein